MQRMMGILACRSGKPFADKVYRELKRLGMECKSIDSEEVQFSNSEIKVALKDKVQGCDVCLFQDVENSTNSYSVADNVAGLKSASHAARLSGASSITAVLPTFPYARQDKPKFQEGITASAFAAELELYGISRVITADLHNEAVQGFFRTAVLENIRAFEAISEGIKAMGLQGFVVTAPDVGALQIAKRYAQYLDSELVAMFKTRPAPNLVDRTILIGDVAGKDVLIVDDMIDTGGTLIASCEELKKNGAKRIIAACTLPLFNGPAIERMSRAVEQGVLFKVIGTDAVYHGEDFEKKYPWYKSVSIAPLFAQRICNY